ncbi:MAG: redox-sensing transcriptional repressor Rex [Verrucomicrobia bacterium]|nr:redox-sensing transcriptional repressor Rex [Verrucomicrobiota bacterium]
MSTVENTNLPAPVLRRFPRYLTHLRELKKANQVWVSSREIAATLGLTTSTVRQDISHLDMTGVSKRGYEVSLLEKELGEVLGAQTIHRSVIVGAGLLGRALALHADFEEHGFITAAIFDNNPAIIGEQIEHLKVRPMDDLEATVRDEGVEIGVIAVPADAAQGVADRLCACGIKGLLNLAHTHLHTPSRVVVVEARILARMQQIAYAIRSRQATNGSTTSVGQPLIV